MQVGVERLLGPAARRAAAWCGRRRRCGTGRGAARARAAGGSATGWRSSPRPCGRRRTRSRAVQAAAETKVTCSSAPSSTSATWAISTSADRKRRGGSIGRQLHAATSSRKSLVQRMLNSSLLSLLGRLRLSSSASTLSRRTMSNSGESASSSDAHLGVVDVEQRLDRRVEARPCAGCRGSGRARCRASTRAARPWPCRRAPGGAVGIVGENSNSVAVQERRAVLDRVVHGVQVVLVQDHRHRLGEQLVEHAVAQQVVAELAARSNSSANGSVR